MAEITPNFITALLPLAQLSGGLFAIAFALKQATIQYRAQTRRRTAFMDFLLVGEEKKPTENSTTQQTTQEENKNHLSKPLSLLLSLVGLQTCYLAWGVLQEKIMTTQYGELMERFPSTSMLVLSNRAFAIVFAALAMRVIPQPHHRAPFVEYSFAAVANTISSWCQYEALRFVSFPMSTVSKACKIIPTMIMGTIIQRKTYALREYLSALVITMGVVVFALESGGGGVSALFAPEQFQKLDLDIAVPGGVLLITYLIVDAFTSNWQNHLFRAYEISSYQCMLGINVFSTLLGLFNLAQEPTKTMESIFFLVRNPTACVDVLAMSLSSALGQLFIYYTIERHGAVVFTIISVTRQLLSIALSSVMFGHVISHTAWVGVFLTFFGVLLNAYGGGGANKRGSVPKKE